MRVKGEATPEKKRTCSPNVSVWPGAAPAPVPIYRCDTTELGRSERAPPGSVWVIFTVTNWAAPGGVTPLAEGVAVMVTTGVPTSSPLGKTQLNSQTFPLTTAVPLML